VRKGFRGAVCRGVWRGGRWGPGGVSWEAEVGGDMLTARGFLMSASSLVNPVPSATGSANFSFSLCGSCGATLGCLGSLSSTGVFFLSDKPPSVPRVPSSGFGLYLSSITPSLDCGSPSLDCAVGTLTVSLPFFPFRSDSVSTHGPSCGMPSLPSTGACSVPIGAARASTGPLAGSKERGCNFRDDAVESVAMA
jgi:hypothetical protein